MPARSLFQGLRFEFLEKERPAYAEALKNNSKEDFLKDVIRRFFKRFPVELDMDKDPTEDHLKAVDDSKPDPVLPIPNAKDMSPEEYRVALKAYEDRQELIERRTGQITRWFTYRHDKEVGTAKEIDLDDPITILTCRLTGASSFKPRKPVASNMWAKLNKELVDEAFTVALKSSLKSTKGARVDINVRQEAGRALFKALPDVDQRYWNLRAEQEHRRQLLEWEEAVRRPASQDPEARQQCIDRITGFMQPILDLVLEFTGMPTTFMMGGPEPADKGRLNIISLHSGSVRGPVKMNFGEAEQAGYKEQVVPVFSSFLRKCFTREDCRAAALPSGATSLLQIIDDHTINYDRAVGDDSDDDAPLVPSKASSTTKVSAPAPGNTSSTTQVPASVPPQKTSSSSRHQRKKSHGSQRQEAADSRREGRGVVASVGDNPSQSLTTSQQPHLGNVDDAAGGVPNQGTRPSADGLPQRPLTPPHDPPSCPPSAPPSPSSPKHALPAAGAGELPQHPVTSESNQPSLPPGIKFGHPRRPRNPVNTPSSAPLGSTHEDAQSKSVGQKRQAEDAAGKDQRSKRRRPSDKENEGGSKKRKDIPDEEDIPSKRVKPSGQSSALVPVPPLTSTSASSPLASTSATESVLPPTPTLPEDCQLPIKNTLTMVKRMALGASWDRLVNLWLRFEGFHEFKGSSQLSTVSRPPSIKAWVQRARAPTFSPSLDTGEFGTEFWAWWAVLQPNWRSIEPDTTKRLVLGGWDALDKPGTNGWPSIVAALFFWGRALHLANKSTSSWTLAVEDVSWVLDKLCQVYSA